MDIYRWLETLGLLYFIPLFLLGISSISGYIYVWHYIYVRDIYIYIDIIAILKIT